MRHVTRTRDNCPCGVSLERGKHRAPVAAAFGRPTLGHISRLWGRPTYSLVRLDLWTPKPCCRPNDMGYPAHYNRSTPHQSHTDEHQER